jgi:hypothetical protein
MNIETMDLPRKTGEAARRFPEEEAHFVIDEYKAFR